MGLKRRQAVIPLLFVSSLLSLAFLLYLVFRAPPRAPPPPPPPPPPPGGYPAPRPAPPRRPHRSRPPRS
jgi:hypothetical protein